MHTASDHEAPAEIRRLGLATLLSGSLGYRTFLNRMEKFIVSAEAERAKRTFEQGYRHLKIVTCGYLIAHLLGTMAALQGLGSDVALGYFFDLERGGLFISAYLLASRSRVPIAGRWLMLLASFAIVPLGSKWISSWFSLDADFAKLLLGLGLTGWLLDIGAWRGSFEARRRVRRWCLPLAGAAFWATLAMENSLRSDRGLSSEPIGLSLLAPLACCAWEVRTALVRKADALAPNVELLHEAGWKRWQFAMTGRTLAILLSVFPFWGILNFWDIATALQSHVTTQAKSERPVHTIGASGQAFVWSWAEKGRLLTERDYGRYHLFRSPNETDAPAARDEIRTLTDLLREKPNDADTLVRLRTALTRLQLKNDADFAAAERDKSVANIYCLPNDVPKQDEGAESFAPLTIGGRAELLPIPAQTLEGDIRNLRFISYAFLIFGIVGFAFLWRRGGDSQLARWLGVWLIGASTAASMAYDKYFLLSAALWVMKQLYSAQGALAVWAFHSLIEMLVYLSPLLMIGVSYGIFQGIVWGLVCAMPRPIQPGETRFYRWLCWRNLAVSAAASIFVVCLPGLVSGVKFSTGSDAPVYYYAHGCLLSTALGVALGWLLRRRTRTHSELPILGPWPVLGYVAVNLSLACLLYLGGFAAGAMATTLAWCMAACATGFAAVALYLIIKRDFLHVRAIRSLVTLFLIAILPILLRLAENRLDPLLDRTPFFSERGSELVLVFVAVWCVPVIHRRLEHFIRRFADRKLHRIEQAVDEALDAIVEARSHGEKQEHLAELFTGMRVKEYALYSYRGGGAFVRDASSPDHLGIRHLTLSGELRKFLGRRHAFQDLDNSVFEWPSFFHMFDLNALRRETTCRYLLPISVGDKLVALLFLPAGESPAESDDPDLTASFKNLGVGAISRTGN